jgi:uncharacterized LabA/DUF88 family protein
MGRPGDFSLGHFFWLFYFRESEGVLPRVSFFIDGFNFYHSLKDPKYFNHPTYQDGTPKYRKYLWLDYAAFLARYLRPQDTIADAFYFSAYAHHRSHRSVKTHQQLVSAWKNTGIKTIMGNFKEKDRFCTNCYRYFKAHEEKETDVNIAIYLINEAYKNTYDTAILVTNDTDLVPAIKMLKTEFPRKKVGVLFPIERWSSELEQECDFVRYTRKGYLSKSQFPDPIILPSGIQFPRPPIYT